MRQSELFTKTRKNPPSEEESVNAKLLIRAGFLDKVMAGVYSYLPLGFLVLKKIENIIREEMLNISAQEILMPALHPKKVWQRTNRWKYPEMFKIKNRFNKDYSLGWTHEEIVAPLIKKFVQSYKDLPVAVFQIQDKFRDELRAKSGLLRGVEFIMKDLYSFHENEAGLDGYYEKVKKAYFRIFERCGIKKQTFLTFASGGSFAKFSHEFQTLTPSGEDTVYLCSKCRIGVNQEIIEDQHHKCPGCGSKNLKAERAIEVGNIFKLKTRFSDPLDLSFIDKDGKDKIIMMGCYGIGLGRLMGTIVEVHHDQKGIVWPEQVAPFNVHLISIGSSKEVSKQTENVYQSLRKSGVPILYDDRKDKSPGEKFADYDLIGIPSRMVISDKTIEKKSFELKERNRREIRLVKIKNLTKFFKESSKC